MFTLDHRIDRDSTLIAKLSLCQLRIQNDQRYAWLVLVPEVINENGNEITEVHELNPEQSQQLIHESNVVSLALKTITQCRKINVANLGNVCAQLHWHVVARNEGDLTWPGPIWGVGEAVPWDQKKRRTLVTSLLKTVAELDSNLIQESNYNAL